MSVKRPLVRLVVTALVAATLVSIVGAMPAYADNSTLTLKVCFVPDNFGNCPVDTGLTHTQTKTAGSTITMTATLSATPDQSTQVQVDWDFESGPNDPSPSSAPGTIDFNCVIVSGQTSCAASYTANVTGTDQLRVSIHGRSIDATEGVDPILTPGGTAEPDSTGVLQETVTAGTPGPVLDCNTPGANADVVSASVKGPRLTYTCTVTVNGTGVPASRVDGEITAGVNDTDGGKKTPADFNCTTDAQGNCPIQVPDGSIAQPFTLGQTSLCFWVDTEKDDKVDDANASNGAECNTTPVGAPEASTSTDTETINWVNPVVTEVKFSSPTTGDDSFILPGQTTATIKVTVVDQFGNAMQLQKVDVKVLSGPDRTIGLTDQFSCVTVADGTCSGTVTNSSGLNGRDEYCAWFDANGDDVYTPGGASQDGGNCLAALQGAPNSHPAGDKLTIHGRLTWSGGTTSPTVLDVAPESQIATVGAIASLTATVTDENGNLMSGAVVDFEITGAGDPDGGDSKDTPDRVCTTDGTGTCTLAGSQGASGGITSTQPGGISQVFSWTVSGGVSDTTEGQDGTTAPGITPEPDTTDVVKVQWGRAPTQLTISMSPTIGTYGYKPTASGKLTATGQQGGLASQTINIYRSVNKGASTLIGTTQTDANGNYSLKDPSYPIHNAEYRATFNQTSNYEASSTGLAGVRVRVGMPSSQTASRVPRGTVVYFGTTVLPAHPGTYVVFQIFDGGAHVWKTLANVRLDANSRARIGYRLNVAGFRMFRFAWPTHPDNATNTTSNKGVTWT